MDLFRDWTPEAFQRLMDEYDYLSEGKVKVYKVHRLYPVTFYAVN